MSSHVSSIGNNEIDKLLPLIDTTDCKSAQKFIAPYGDLRVNIMHLAAYSGRLEILKDADALGLDLYVVDNDGKCALHYASQQGHVDIVKWFVERSTDRDQLSHQDYCGKTALHLAVETKHVNIVKFLVEGGVDPNVSDKEGRTPLHLTSSNVSRHNPEWISRYEKIVEILVSSPDFTKLTYHPWSVEIRSLSILNEAVKLNSCKALELLLERGLDIKHCDPKQITSTPVHIAAESGSHDTLLMLLKYPGEYFLWMINIENVMGETPVELAAINGHSKCAQILLHFGGSLAPVDSYRRTVMQHLFRYNERAIDFLTDIFDTSIFSTEHEPDAVTLFFNVLSPQGQRQMAVVSDLITAAPSMKQMKILQHPLVEAFLAVKWTPFRYFPVILLIFQALFVVCLSWYGILLQNGDDHPSVRWLLLPFGINMVLHKTLQLVTVPKYYWKQFETWLALICAMICIVVPVAGEFGLPHSWVLAFISIALIAAYIQIMLLIGIFPSWGYYGLMFYAVLKKVLKVLLALVWIIVGLALSLSILFSDKDNFDNPWKAAVKTVVMMMGEYDYNDLLDRMDNHTSTLDNTDSNTNQSNVLPITKRVVLLVFIMLASIVLMNLMTALAVVDVQELLNEGHIRQLIKRVELIAHLEQATSHWIFQRQWVPGRLRTMLESMKTIPIVLYLTLPILYWKEYGISKELGKRVLDLASKNRDHRYKRHTDSSNSANKEDSFTAVQVSLKRIEQWMDKSLRQQSAQGPSYPGHIENSLAAIQASLNRIEEWIPNSQIQRLGQDMDIKRQRRSV